MSQTTIRKAGTPRSFWFHKETVQKLVDIASWLGLDQTKVMRLLIEEKHSQLSNGRTTAD